MYLNEVVHCPLIVFNPLLMSHDIISVLFNACDIQCAHSFQSCMWFNFDCVYTNVSDILQILRYSYYCMCVPYHVDVCTCVLFRYVSVLTCLHGGSYIHTSMTCTYNSKAICMYSHCLYICSAVLSLPVQL